MRTKTLLLTAAVSAAGVASSMAQANVFSVNAVGYVNTTLTPKFNLIANPLNAADNSINALFKNGVNGTIPNGLQVYKFNGTSFTTLTYDDLDGSFGTAGAATLVPGEGAFVRVPGTANVTITFVGEVMQGDLKNAYPKGLSIRSSQVPQEGIITDLGFKGKNGDQIFMYDTAGQKYVTSTFDDIDGAFAPKPRALKVGESLFLKATVAGSWDRTFSVNN